MLAVWLFLKTFWRPIAIGLTVLALLGYWSHYKHTIYQEGFTAGQVACNKEWQKKEKERTDAINNRIDKLASTSETVAKEQREYLGGVSGKITTILSQVKTLTGDVKKLSLTTVPDCKPSDKFIEMHNEIAKAANTQ